MREFREPTARNLLRRPLVLGVPLMGLLGLSFIVLSILLFSGGGRTADSIALGFGLIGYIALRVLQRFGSPGWEEGLIFRVEKILRKKGLPRPAFRAFPSGIQVSAVDTLDSPALLVLKDQIREGLVHLRSSERMYLHCEMGLGGAHLQRYEFDSSIAKGLDFRTLWPSVFTSKYVYSLVQLPVISDPLWLSGLLNRLGTSRYQCLVTFEGIDFWATKRRIERARRVNSSDPGARVSDVDSDVSFSEASRVLEGLSRGDECVLEASFVIASDEPLDLDPHYFILEENTELALLAITGLRKRFHRSHTVRSVTASDLIPNLLDPLEGAASILKTPRGMNLYFSPQDPRLEALHGLVVGASGSGKSFFTGLVLLRLIEARTPMSVLFVDHNRSFRRLVRERSGVYAEPETAEAAAQSMTGIFRELDRPGAMAGIELSDLTAEEKKRCASEVLSGIEDYLRSRRTSHPVYVVLDECWNFLRDEPVLVQRAFREYRKLNGAVWAITQSLSDFLSDSSGRSIFQNAPIRILLRQGDDLTPYRGVLDLNDVELSKTRLLRQVKGEFSECLIKTPFLSRIGRLYPTSAEHVLLRTDNLRSELIAETTARILEVRASVCPA